MGKGQKRIPYNYRQTYPCKLCFKRHRRNSSIGKRHYQYRSPFYLDKVKP